MKKLKKALSLTLALALSLVLALPAASAADVEDSPYIKFSNKPNSYGYLKLYERQGSSDYFSPGFVEDGIIFPFLVFPDNTVFSLTAELDNRSPSLMCNFYDNGWWGDVYLYIDDDEMKWTGGGDDYFDLDAEFPIEDPYMIRCVVYDYTGWEFGEEELIEDFYFCTQSTFDEWVSAGLVASFTTDITEQPTEPSTPTTPSTPVPTSVVLSPQKLTVDGKDIECEKYNIDGSNYFKLRDLARLLNGTGSQFAVGYDDATSTVTITTGEAYEPTGTELVTGVDNSATAQPSNQTITINGVAHGELTVYNIGGSNFFQLRELGNILGFEVDYDVSTDTAIVNSVQK